MADFEGFSSWGTWEGKPFWQRMGPAEARGKRPCQAKICLVATDLEYLVECLRTLAARDDCFGVKFSEGDRDGMHLGRCMLTDREAVGEEVARLKADSKLMVTVQDDAFFARFRSRP